MKKLNINVIRVDGETQSRERIDAAVVADYAEALGEGAEFPPVVVFHDGSDYWMADGFHRLLAHQRAGRASIDADIRTGTVDDAILFALGANDGHGLRRTNADKRRCVARLLARPAWAKWSESKMAEVCRVSRTLVRAVIEEAHLVEKQDVVRTVERAGKTYQQDTSRIGKSKPAPAATTVAAPRPTPEREPAPVKRAAWDKTPAPTNAPTTADDAFDGFDPIAELEATQKRLEEAEKRIEALSTDDTKAELAKQIGIRQGIEARLSLEMKKVSELQRELDSYGKWYAELRKVSGLEKRSEITRLVREAANAGSAAV